MHIGKPRKYALILSCFVFLFVGPSHGKSVKNPQGKKMPNTIDQFIKERQAGGQKANRLINEKSPYLLQHAFNPVDWYPWGEEAFAKAKAEDKPIFLSIGYSTCHWCHVMAHESFESEEVAAILNKYFVCIKVDREERPDVDQIYMAAVQAMTGGGGWPMSVFITPDLKPFYGGTYFPPEAKHGLPGFSQILLAIQDAWLNKRDDLLVSADKITAHLKQDDGETAKGNVNAKVLEKGFQQINREFDETYAGFGRAPKFPRPVIYNFLLRYYHDQGEERALNMTLLTLRKMAAGGMYDHIGGGFHRYSVDGQWRVPHFEKMLYDQAQLVVSYIEAYQISQDPFYANVAEDILSYILRDMRDSAGGFYSAEDADSQDPHDKAKHGEGLFYLWDKDEIVEILGEEHAKVFNFHYGVKKNGNALNDPQNEFVGKNILYVAHSLEETADHYDKPEAEVAALLEQARVDLMGKRQQRPHPHLDDKVITSWNGLMISALAKAAQALGKDEYAEAATKAADFIFDTLYEGATGQLKRRYRVGSAGLDGQLDDYAFLIAGLLDLYEATFEIEWLKRAVALTEKQLELFWDEKNSGFFDTTGKDPSVLVQMKSDYDGAEPTGNSIAALNLLRLAWMTGNDDWQKRGLATIEAFSGRLNEYPPILPQMLVAHGFSQAKPTQVVIAGKIGKADTEIMLSLVRKRFLPNKIILFADGVAGQKYLGAQLPFLAEVAMLDNKATAYICENYTCQLPTTDIAKLVQQLDALERGKLSSDVEK